jgi:beta-phosphoglucomutase
MKETMPAFVFDMDGVIVDNHQYHVKAWNQFFEKYDLEVTEEDFKHHINGRTIMEVIYYLFGEDTDQQQAQQYADEKEQLYREIYKEHIQAVKGLQNFLEKLKEKGYPLAICTSAPKENISFTLQLTHTESFFDQIIDMEGVRKGKPHPEIYQKAARELGLSPARCIVFEDSVSGIKSAKDAGCPVVALSTTHTKEELKETACDLIIKDFTQADLQEILELA